MIHHFELKAYIIINGEVELQKGIITVMGRNLLQRAKNLFIDTHIDMTLNDYKKIEISNYYFKKIN